MSNEAYYKFWLCTRADLENVLSDDKQLQQIAVNKIGIKPQSAAIDLVAAVYSKYCNIFNRLCEYYDQMGQIQRRPFIRTLIDAVTCRILELKAAFQDVESFEYTYPHNSLVKMFMVPQDVEILCPFFYPLEIREKEMQYIIDEIMAGNRIGDPEPTPSELERREEERLEEERRIQEEKLAEIKRKMAMGEEIEVEDDNATPLTPEEQEALRLKAEYDFNVTVIQAMERCRQVTKTNVHKQTMAAMTYLELAGTKKPPAPLELREKAAVLIQMIARKFMQLKRDHIREDKLKLKLGMTMPSYSPPSFKIEWERVKDDRRKFRKEYYEKWLAVNLKENDRIMRLRKDDMIEDITSEVRAWMKGWHEKLCLFDEYPWPDEGGSVLICRGDTFTYDEYLEWRQAEDKRLKEEAESPKTKEQIKAEKKAEKEEKKRLAQEEAKRAAKELSDYKKQRLNPEKDPGVYVQPGNQLETILEAYDNYKTEWKHFDYRNAPLDVKQGYIMGLIIENQYQNVHLEVRPIADELMRMELVLLKQALKMDYTMQGKGEAPTSKKRKKPRKRKAQKGKFKRSPENMFQELVDNGIVRKYPKMKLNEYWGDLNYAAADLRIIPWTPKFTPACMGDVRDQFRVQCLMALGCDCPGVQRCMLLVGPKSCGKRTLVYSLATETNAVIMDLSPLNTNDKYPGPKNLKNLFNLVNIMSRLLQPTIILVDNAEKIFYKKVPKEELSMDPTAMKNVIFKDLIKPLKSDDKILVLGTSSEPWVALIPLMKKAFPNIILFPKTDYGSISLVLYKLIMQFHGIKREFDVHSVAQVIRGYDIGSIRRGVAKLMEARRISRLTHDPLDPVELLSSVLDHGNPPLPDKDFELFADWYSKYSPWAIRFEEYKFMLETQYEIKLKNDKKKKGG